MSAWLSNTICGVLSNWAFTKNRNNKWGCQQSRSLENDRWLSITLQYHSAMPKAAQQGHRASRSILVHSFFSQTRCSKHSSFHVFRNQDEQFVLCHFVIFVVIVIFRAIKLQRTIINRNKWVLVLSTRLLPLVSSNDSTCSPSRSTPSSMLGTSRRKHGVHLPTATTLGSLNINRFIINACIHNLIFQ